VDFLIFPAKFLSGGVTSLFFVRLGVPVLPLLVVTVNMFQRPSHHCSCFVL